ncbi:DUF6491 family protein [bacterium]|jgi:hypothetical protein|nr:DUF6491 family protein [bacterium]
MDEHDKNFIKNMSPLLIAAMVMFLMMAAYDTKADDHMYTDHGILITEQDLQVKSIRVNSIRGYTIVDNDTIRVRTNRREEFDIKVYSCFDISFAHRLVFQPWGGFSSLSRGDRIIPISFGRASRFPCTIRSITAVLKEKEDDKEN